MTRHDPTAIAPEAIAALDAIRRTGAEGIEIRYSDPSEDGDDGPVVWMAVAKYAAPIGGRIADPPGPTHRYEVDAAMNPSTAVLRLAERLIDGGECRHCHRPTVFDADPFGAGALDVLGCVYRFDPELNSYRRSCEGKNTPNPAGNRESRHRVVWNPMSSYPILPPATRVRIHNRLERTRDAVNELLTSARDNAAALDQAAEELDPESTDAIELRGAAEALLRIAAAARTDRDAIVARRNYWPTEAAASRLAEVALELAVATEARRGRR